MDADEAWKGMGYASRDEFLIALGLQMGMEYVSLDQVDIPPDVIARVPAPLARAFSVVPVHYRDNVLTVALVNPHDTAAIEDLRMVLKCEVKGAVAGEAAMLRALLKYYGPAPGEGPRTGI